MKLFLALLCTVALGVCPLAVAGEEYLRGSVEADNLEADVEDNLLQDWERDLGSDDSVTTQPAKPGTNSPCFSPIATVEEQLHGPTPMKDLKVGHKILTQSGKFLEVYAFAHLEEEDLGHFLQIYTSKTEPPLEITGQHLVYLQNKLNPVRADSVRIGDRLMKGPNQGGTGQVIKIQKTQREGLYAPLTAEGNLVVDGVVASSYISLQQNANEFISLANGMPLRWLSQHNVVHMALSPFRMMCLGISSNLCNTYNPADGKPYFVSWGLSFAEWADQQHLFLQPFVLAFFLTVCALFVLVEMVFGASNGPLAVLFGMVGYVVLKRSGLNIRVLNSGKTKKCN